MTQDEALKLALWHEAMAREPNRNQAKREKHEATAKFIKEALAQPEQEPVGQLLEDAFGRGQVMWFNKPKDESMLYTTPPQRTWVGLTEEEQLNVFAELIAKPRSEYEVYKAYELALKEKNTLLKNNRRK